MNGSLPLGRVQTMGEVYVWLRTTTHRQLGEMRERVNAILQGQKLHSAPLISTFHSLCVRILRQDIEHLQEGYSKSFTIYDTDDSIKVIKACIKDIGLDDKQLPPRQVQNAISASKNRGEDYEMYASRVEYTDERRAAWEAAGGSFDESFRFAMDWDALVRLRDAGAHDAANQRVRG